MYQILGIVYVFIRMLICSPISAISVIVDEIGSED
jgi:hypothetical protein